MPVPTVAKAVVFPEFLSQDVVKIKKRETLEGVGNPTSSLHDSFFCQVEEADSLDDWEFCLNNSRPLIEQHLERRVSLLFVQAVVCYRTNYQFREGHTVHQGFNAHTLYYDQHTKSRVFQAAHCATLPCLYAKAEGIDHEFIFLYRSGYYDESNATICALKEVNDADRAIDEKRETSQLRVKTVAHLSAASRGLKTPVEVAKRFMLDLMTEIRKSLGVETNQRVIDVLEVYLEKAELLWSMADQPETYDRWLDVNMDDPLLPTLTLQNQGGLDESEKLTVVRKKIDALALNILQGLYRDENTCRAPVHFSDLYHLCVLTACAGPYLHAIESATDVQLAALAIRCKAHKRAGKTIDLLQKNTAAIHSLAQDLIGVLVHQPGMPAAAMHVEQEQKRICLRPSIYRLRYTIIQADQMTQSSIKSKTDNVLRIIKQQTGSIGYVDLFFYYNLFVTTNDQHMQVMLCKLFNISLFSLSRNRREVKLNAPSHTTLEKHSNDISRLVNEVKGLVLQGQNPEAGHISNRIHKLLETMRSEKNSKYLRELFYKRLFEECATINEKNSMQTLLHISVETLDLQIHEWSKVPKAELNIQSQLDRVQEVYIYAREQMHMLRRQTAHYKQTLLTELRLSHGMSQSRFVEVYKGKHPHHAMSPATLSRLENGGKSIDSVIIGHVAEIFGVSASLFHPSHFAA
jgi:hypothetical protein